MATTAIIPLHAGKGRTVAAALGLSVDYVENPDKTGGGEWVTSYQCDPLIADSEFLFSKRQYAAITGRDQGERDVIGYHLRISFKPSETDAATANRIGYQLAMKLTRGRHAFVCCTHIDKAHVHSHIVINSTSLDCTRKFRNFKGSAFAVRRIADHLCVENGLSIITNPKPSRGSYASWQGDEKPPSNREKLGRMIDAALTDCKDFDGFLAAMREAGAEVKRGKHLAFRIPGAERFARCKSMGSDYTEDAIRERISGRRIAAPKQKTAAPVTAPTKPNLLIDIQAKIQQGYGPGFEHYARLYNLKESAKTLIFLQERGLADYDLLTEKAKAASAVFGNHNERRKAIEARLKEITELQKHIGAYGKTREVYREYRALPPKKRAGFLEDNRSDITVHRAAKEHFDSLGYGKDKKLPSMQSLKQEYAALDAERRTLSRGYKAEHDEMVALQMAKQNVDRLLGEPRQRSKSHERDTR